MDMQNTELNIESSEESHVYSEKEREQIISEALMICAEAIESVRQDVSKLIADLSSPDQTH